MRTDTDGAPARDSTVVLSEVELSEAGRSMAASVPARVAPAETPRGLRVRTRIFLAVALLVVFAVGAAVSVATWRAEAVAERTIREALAHVPQAFVAFRGNVERLLREKLRSIAEEPGTKSLFAGGDAPTRWEFARDVAKLHGAQTVFLFDGASAVLARSDRPVGEGAGQPFGGVKWVADVLDSSRETSATIREGNVLSLVAAVPVFSGEGSSRVLTGVLAASFPLDAARAREVQGITRGEVGFLRNVAKRGEPPRLEIAAATPGLGGEAFSRALAAAPSLNSIFAGEPAATDPLDLSVGGERRLVVAYPLRSATDETLGALVVSRSREEETAAFREIRDTLFVVGVVALVAAIPISLAIGRGIARPIEQLAAGAQAIREGNLAVTLPQGGSGEVGALARAFGQMVDELKEKAALEGLVAEMQRRPGDVTGFGATRTIGGSGGAVAAGGGATGGGPRVGHVFGGRYDIQAMLGRGGMGAVYRAVDRELDDEVALKVLDPQALAHGASAVQTLKHEIKLARKITHQNVVRTHDLGESDGVRFLTMEYVPGTTLRELIDRRGALALGPGLQIAKQLVRGLVAVHEAGILHRDIKPANVMVLPNGVVKLMDFGISSVAGGNRGDEFIVGTPAYMSPEQALGQPLDPRSDLYSVGAVMYEIFTGEKAFAGDDSTAAFQQRLAADPPRPARIRADLPEPIEKIILGCLAPKPSDRPASASSVYAALMRLAG